MSKAEKRKWCVEQLESEQLRGSATDLVNVVQPFIDVLREVDSGQTFMGMIYHRLFTIQQQLRKKKRNGVVTGSLADKAIDILNEYCDKVHCPTMTVRYALDPEFKFVPVSDPKKNAVRACAQWTRTVRVCARVRCSTHRLFSAHMRLTHSALCTIVGGWI